MNSKRDTPKNSGSEKADKGPNNRLSKAIDESQVTMNFGQGEEAKTITEQDFKRRAEAEMKKRAQEGQRLREEMEVQKRTEQEKHERKEAQARERAAEDQRLQKEVEAQELKLKEEAQARERAAEEQRLQKEVEAQELKLKEEAQVKERFEMDQKKHLEEARLQREMEEKKRNNRTEAAIRARDEAWRKFKEEADNRGNRETADHHEPTDEINENFEETAQTKTSPKSRALLLLLIAAFAIAVLWIFSVFNKGTDKSMPDFPNNEAIGVENTGVSPETNDLENQTNIENTGVSPETETDTESQTEIDDASVPSEPEAENPEASSNSEVGDPFGKGIIFKMDSSGKTGTIAYSKDTEPMTWENAMNINEQLGEGWRLPTMEELSEMYTTIGPGSTNNSGRFTEELYWSAQAYDKNQARLVRFSDGDTSFHYNKSAEHRKFLVRAVRDFSE